MLQQLPPAPSLFTAVEGLRLEILGFAAGVYAKAGYVWISCLVASLPMLLFSTQKFQTPPFEFSGAALPPPARVETAPVVELQACACWGGRVGLAAAHMGVQRHGRAQWCWATRWQPVSRLQYNPGGLPGHGFVRARVSHFACECSVCVTSLPRAV